ncbi:mitogen-activated protein kinase [Malassezia nana]|uniref:Mitogen-activated protein kinase n=1 Tax=Malassezia nana TaxID=180528 RepID=A0AAF0EGF6_9BASI|nr:mitogen-activated protein kinase [Malassezia nana]
MSGAERPNRIEASVLNQTFLIDPAYRLLKGLGQGAYGCVASAEHIASGESIAIKRVSNVFNKRILTKRALREIKYNITCLYDLDITNPAAFNEIYLYEELMEADLHAIPLTDTHFQSFIYQTLCGLKYIHSANVLHRDLKPGNLLVNADCELKICDFGLSRGFDPDGNTVLPGQQEFMTEYVATRWYRAPEIMLSHQNYTTAIDMWSVGCILAELLGRRPLFKGRDYVDQLNQILHYLGHPTESMLQRIASPRAQQYIRSLPYKPRIPFEQLYPKANPLALDLLRRLLAFDPSERITCDEALAHPYLAVWHDPADESVCQSKFDFSFENIDDIAGMKKLILDEVISFRREVRWQAQQRLAMMQSSNTTTPASAQTCSVNKSVDVSPYGAPSSASLRRQDQYVIRTDSSLPGSSRHMIEQSTQDTQYHILGERTSAHGEGRQDENEPVAEVDAMEDPYESLSRQLSEYKAQ